MVGGIFIPDTAKEETWEDEGLAAGFGEREGPGRRIKFKIKAGDCILCSQLCGWRLCELALHASGTFFRVNF